MNEYHFPPSFSLIQKLYIEEIFNKQELIEIYNKICFDKMMKSEIIACIQEFQNDSHQIADLDNSFNPQDPDYPIPPNVPTPPSNGSSPSPLFYLGQSSDSRLKYLLIAIGALLIATSFKLQVLAAITAAIVGSLMIAFAVRNIFLHVWHQSKKYF